MLKKFLNLKEKLYLIQKHIPWLKTMWSVNWKCSVYQKSALKLNTIFYLFIFFFFRKKNKKNLSIKTFLTFFSVNPLTNVLIYFSMPKNKNNLYLLCTWSSKIFHTMRHSSLLARIDKFQEFKDQVVIFRKIASSLAYKIKKIIIIHQGHTQNEL